MRPVPTHNIDAANAGVCTSKIHVGPVSHQIWRTRVALQMVCALLFLVLGGNAMAAIVGDITTAYDYYHEYPNPGINTVTTNVDDRHVAVYAPDGRVFYGGANGSSGLEGYYPVTVTYDMPGTWYIEDYGYNETDGQGASFWYSYPVQVTAN